MIQQEVDMEHYVVGLDGGGTKTAMQISDMNGRVLLSYEAGGLNYNSNTKKELKVTIHKLLSVLLVVLVQN